MIPGRSEAGFSTPCRDCHRHSAYLTENIHRYIHTQVRASQECWETKWFKSTFQSMAAKSHCEIAVPHDHYVLPSAFSAVEKARRLEWVREYLSTDCWLILPHRAVLGIARRPRQSCLWAMDGNRLSFCLVWLISSPCVSQNISLCLIPRILGSADKEVHFWSWLGSQKIW